MSDIHAFALPPENSLYRAVERLTDSELDERIELYENARIKILDKRKKACVVSKTLVDIMESNPATIPILILPAFATGLIESAYCSFFLETPFILDNVNPLVGPELAYSAAIAVRDFRRTKKSNSQQD